MSEKPVHSRLRKLVDWINLTGGKKVHSLIDKVAIRKKAVEAQNTLAVFQQVNMEVGLEFLRLEFELPPCIGEE